VGMNLIDYNQAVEALDKERQLLVNREQYGAENVLVKHALNVIAELPVIRQPEIVRCKDCKSGEVGELLYGEYYCLKYGYYRNGDWFCADGERSNDK